MLQYDTNEAILSTVQRMSFIESYSCAIHHTSLVFNDLDNKE